MIVRLTPTQVSGMWDLVKTGIIDFGAKHFPGNWGLSNEIFHRCLAGTVQVWLCSDVEDEKVDFKGFFLTSVELDNIDSGRTLAVLLIYALKQPSKELIQEGKSVLESYAKSNLCKQITIITPQGHREKLVENVWPKAAKKTIFVISVGA